MQHGLYTSNLLPTPMMYCEQLTVLFMNWSTETMYNIRHSNAFQTSTPLFNMNVGFGELGAEDGQVWIWGIALYHRKKMPHTTGDVEFVHMLCINLLLLHLSEGQSSGLMYSTMIANHLFPYSIRHLFSPESLVLTQKYPYSHRMMYNCIEGQKISHSTRTVCHF